MRENRLHGSEGGEGESPFRPLSNPNIQRIMASLAQKDITQATIVRKLSSYARQNQTKKALWGALEAGLTDACKNGAKHLVDMWGHPDQEEGPAAFAEKRDANWAPLTPSE